MNVRTKSHDFSSIESSTNTYDVRITNLNTSTATNKNGVASTSTTATLDKGVPYSWKVTSKNTSSTTTTGSDTWKFYLAGDGVVNYAPFPADLKTPASGSTVTLSDGKATFTWEGTDPDSGDTLQTWKKYYSELGVKIPQNELGINPGIMSLSEKIEIVHIYGYPDGMKR